MSTSLYPADPGVAASAAEPRVAAPRAGDPDVPASTAEPRSLSVPPLQPALPQAFGVGLADIPARLVGHNGIAVEMQGLDLAVGMDIESLDIAQGQPEHQWVPVWIEGRPVDEIGRVAVDAIPSDAPHDGFVYGRWMGQWTDVTSAVTIEWTDILDKPATFPPTLPIPSSGVTGLDAKQLDQDTKITQAQSEVDTLEGVVSTLASTTSAGLALKANLAGGNALTGLQTMDTVPTHPTATAGDNTTKSATTAFVGSAVSTSAALKVSKAGDSMSGVLTMPNGGVGAPAINFGAPTTGLYGDGAGVYASVAGTNYFQVTASFVLAGSTLRANLSGSAPTPAITLAGVSSTTGFYGSASTLGLSVGGANKCLFGTAICTFAVPVILPAGTTATAPLNLPHGVAPTAPTNGDFWSTSAAFFVRVTGTTYQLATTADITTFAGTLGGIYAKLSGGNALAGLQAMDTTPTFPTATALDSSTKGATTAFVTAADAALSALKVAKAGDTMTGKLTMPAGVVGTAPIVLPHGVAPTSPVNGDLWTTSAGLFVRAGGVTIGPLGPSSGLGGLSTAEYTYTTAITAPPASGNVRMNSVTASAITQVWMHDLNAVDVDISNALRLIDKGLRVLIQDKDNAALYANYLTTGPSTDGGTYWTMPVAWTDGPGGFIANQRVMVCIFGLGITGYLPLSGGTMLGKEILPASIAGSAYFNMPHGTAPSAPVNGDFWTTTAGLFVRVNGTTFAMASTSDITVTAALKANLAGGNAMLGLNTFDTTPTFPTPTAGDNSTKGATTAFVTAAVSGGGSFVPTGGGAMSGALTMNGASPIHMNGAAATDRVIDWQTGGVIRWAMYASSVVEGGANAGSDFGLNSYTDAGAFLSQPLSIKRSTGIATFNAVPVFAGGVAGATGGAIDIAKPASGGSLSGTAVHLDVNTNSLRIYENGGAFRGCTLDLTGCGSQSSFWHSGNFNPASYQPALGFVPVRNYASSINYYGWDGTGVASQTDSTFWGYVFHTTGGSNANGTGNIGRLNAGLADGRGVSCTGLGGTATVGLFIEMTSGSYASAMHPNDAARSANSAFTFVRNRSATAGTADTEHIMRGDGALLSDVAVTVPADYAELFEWADGNPQDERRVGLTVVLDGDKIRLSRADDDPRDILGVISAEPGFCGNAHWDRWQGKYLRDEYGRVRWEMQDQVYWGRGETGEEGKRRMKLRSQLTERDWAAFREEDDVEEVRELAKVLNPDFDPARKYVPRIERPEWDPVGLLGQVPVRDGQVTGDRWRMMRKMAPGIAMWMVR
jgi:hypothetical protein